MTGLNTRILGCRPNLAEVNRVRSGVSFFAAFKRPKRWRLTVNYPPTVRGWAPALHDARPLSGSCGQGLRGPKQLPRSVSTRITRSRWRSTEEVRVVAADVSARKGRVVVAVDAGAAA